MVNWLIFTLTRVVLIIMLSSCPHHHASNQTSTFILFSGILTEIQDHFGVNDSMAGLLQTVFIISYMIFAPLFGFLGDRYSRKWIMAMGVFLWSLTTLLGSFMEVGEVEDIINII